MKEPQIPDPYRGTPEHPEKTPHQIVDDILNGRSNCTAFSPVYGQVYFQRLHDGSIEIVPSDKLRFTVKPETTIAELSSISQRILSSIKSYEEITDKFDPIKTPERRVQVIETLFQRYSYGQFENIPIFACKYGQLIINRPHTTVPDRPASYAYEIKTGSYIFMLDSKGNILNATYKYENFPANEQEKVLNEALQSATISQKSLEYVEKKRQELEAPKGTIKKIKAWVSEKVGHTIKQPPKKLPRANLEQ